MYLKVRPGPPSLGSSWGACAAVLAGLLATFLLTGCGQWPGFGKMKVEAKTAEDANAAFLSYQDALVGRDSEAVTRVFGQPKGVFEKRQGKVWMYARWCVEFDARGTVVRLERDIAASATEEKADGGAQFSFKKLAGAPSRATN